MKKIIAVGIASAAIVLFCRIADADEENEAAQTSLLVATATVSVISAPGTIVFSAADIGHAVHRRWLSRTWAVLQIVAGSVPNLLSSAGYFTVYSTFEKFRMPDGGAPYLALAIVHGVFGVWFATHGILSLGYRRRTDQQVSAGCRISWFPAAVNGGGLAVVAGRF